MSTRRNLFLAGYAAAVLPIKAAEAPGASLTLPIWSAPGQAPGGCSIIPLSIIGIIDVVPQADGSTLYCANTTFGQRWFSEADGLKLVAAWQAWLAKGV